MLAVLAFCSACAAGTAARHAAHVDRNVITHEQILEHHFTNAFEAVEALRGNWLQTKGTDSFLNPSRVLVYLDNTRLGGVESLRAIGVNPIVYIQHFDGVSATARWGLDHGQGVIFVSTHP